MDVNWSLGGEPATKFPLELVPTTPHGQGGMSQPTVGVLSFDFSEKLRDDFFESRKYAIAHGNGHSNQE